MKNIYLFLFSVSWMFTSAQGKAPSPEEADDFVRNQARTDIFQYTEGSTEYRLLEKHKKGELVINGLDIYKIENFQISRLYNCAYIFLDGNKLSEKEINILQKKIIERHKNGESFKDLISEYSMDSSPDSYNFSFVEGEVNRKFLSIVRDQEQGRAYSIDIPEEKWYYVVINRPGNNARKTITASRYYYPEK